MQAERRPLTTPTTGSLLLTPAAGHLSVGRRAAQSLPERWPAVPLLGLRVSRFKAIDARYEGEATGCPFALAAAKTGLRGRIPPKSFREYS